jgi:hypothetical protein
MIPSLTTWVWRLNSWVITKSARSKCHFVCSYFFLSHDHYDHCDHCDDYDDFDDCDHYDDCDDCYDATLRYSTLLHPTPRKILQVYIGYITNSQDYMLLYATLHYSTLLYATLRHSMLLYATLRYSTLLYSTLQKFPVLGAIIFLRILCDNF